MTVRFHPVITVALSVALVTGCATTDEYGQTRSPSATAQMAGIGALTGALGGAGIGSLSANAGRGALIGAIGGALAGAAVGSYMEQQRQDFERVLADEIRSGAIRVEKLPGDQLLVGMTNATAFDFDSDRIKPGFYSTMDKIGRIVSQYGKTQLIVAGHTDSVGSEMYNLQLSIKRGEAVMEHLRSRGIVLARLSADGKGEAEPIADNGREAGRARNRRVEIVLTLDR